MKQNQTGGKSNKQIFHFPIRNATRWARGKIRSFNSEQRFRINKCAQFDFKTLRYFDWNNLIPGTVNKYSKAISSLDA